MPQMLQRSSPSDIHTHKATGSSPVVSTKLLETLSFQCFSDRTLKMYRQHLHSISKHLDITAPLPQLTKTDLEAMVESMHTTLAHNSISSYLRVFKSFLSWCTKQNELKTRSGQDLLSAPLLIYDIAFNSQQWFLRYLCRPAPVPGCLPLRPVQYWDDRHRCSRFPG